MDAVMEHGPGIKLPLYSNLLLHIRMFYFVQSIAVCAIVTTVKGWATDLQSTSCGPNPHDRAKEILAKALGKLTLPNTSEECSLRHLHVTPFQKSKSALVVKIKIVGLDHTKYRHWDHGRTPASRFNFFTIWTPRSGLLERLGKAATAPMS